MGVKTVRKFHHLGKFTHPLSSSPLVDHDFIAYKEIVEIRV